MDDGWYAGTCDLREGEANVNKKSTFQGINIVIERPKGSVREGKDASGKPWRRVYSVDYGYIPKTQGGDGEKLDVFVGDDAKADEAFWIFQKDDEGNFDEYKVMLGFPDKKSAIAAYKAHIPPKYLGSVLTMKVSMLQALLNIEPDVKLAMCLGFLQAWSHEYDPHYG